MKRTLIGSLIILALVGITVLPTFAQGGAVCQNENELLASLLGVDKDTVETARQEGTLNDIAAENDLKLADLAEALVDNQIACDAETQAQILPEIVCASLENPQAIEVNFGSAFQIEWDTVAAKALGLSIEEVLNRTESIAALAEAQGVEVQTLIDTILEEASRQIYNQSQHGFLTDEEANERLSTLTDDVTNFINELPSEREFVSVLDAAREALGLNTTDFYTAMINGSTLLEIASESGVSEDDLRAAVTEAATANIEQARENGFMNDCVADVRLNRVDEIVTDFLNTENPAELIFNPLTPAFSVSMGQIPGNFERFIPQAIPFFPAMPFEFDKHGFHFGDGHGFEFELAPGENFFFGEGMFNFEACPALEGLSSNSITIETAPGERGEVQIVTPDGTFKLREAIEGCFQVDSKDE